MSARNAWKAHKSECKKRRELAASIDKLSADYADTGMNFKGKDVLKRLSATCLDQMPTAEQMALFGERLEEFKRSAYIRARSEQPALRQI